MVGRKHRPKSQIITTTTITAPVSQTMKIWVVMAKVEEIQARSIDKVFDSKEKAHKYITEQEKSEHFVNLGGIDRSIEEWEVE
ncbi:MAG TPA: hypothetical protein VKA95_11895 [Nitrososphaeraceae archaeon]|nr:hypothetical protein [Nitrososphaeraceae archaeon]